MILGKKKVLFFLFFYLIFNFSNLNADNHNIYEVLEIIKKDLKTLERAVYSDSTSSEIKENSEVILDQNSEDVLTRHLLKLTEIENQFQDLTNRFEEINFKIDKLSSRLSKIQADNQLRFQQIEKTLANTVSEKVQNLTSLETENNNEKLMPGTSQPQDLGSISYKDMTDNSENQKTQAIETTSTILTETFENE